MVYILNGDSKIGEHVYSEIGNLICLRHLFRSTAVALSLTIDKYYIYYIDIISAHFEPA